MRSTVFAIALCGALAGGATRAEVLDAQANGFAVKRTLEVAAPPAKVYAAMLQVGQWWNSEHSFSGKAANMTIEPRANGCWCETLPATKGQVAHMRVIYVDPGKALRFEGGLGPLQESGASGHLTWAVAAKGAGSEITWSYDVGGYFTGGFKQIAPAVDGVLGEQMSRLKGYVETGKTP